MLLPAHYQDARIARTIVSGKLLGHFAQLRGYGVKVRASFIASYRIYDAWRVWHDLLAEGLSCGLHRVERLMRQQALKARPRRRGLPKDDGKRPVIAGNVHDRQLSADAPNRKWVADFTYSGPPKAGCTHKGLERWTAAHVLGALEISIGL